MSKSPRPRKSTSARKPKVQPSCDGVLPRLWDEAKKQFELPRETDDNRLIRTAWPALKFLELVGVRLPSLVECEQGRWLIGPLDRPNESDLIKEFLDIHCQLRACLHCFYPASKIDQDPKHQVRGGRLLVPRPKLPTDWPTTPGLKCLGFSGQSALSITIDILTEVHRCFLLWAPFLYDLTSGQVPEWLKQTSTEDDRIVQWFRRAMQGLRDSIFSPQMDNPRGVIGEVQSLYAVLQDELARCLPDETADGEIDPTVDLSIRGIATSLGVTDQTLSNWRKDASLELGKRGQHSHKMTPHQIHVMLYRRVQQGRRSDRQKSKFDAFLKEIGMPGIGFKPKARPKRKPKREN